MRSYQLFTLAAVLAAACSAQSREFEDKFGRTMDAELVSHVGADAETVKIRRDGKDFDVRVDLFSARDQEFIREWMKATPPTLDYAFRIEAEKGQLTTAGTVTGSTRKSDRWVYRLTVTNLTRQPVSNITVEYATWIESRSGRLVHNYGKQVQEAPMRYNDQLPITTDSVRTSSYRYRSYWSSYRGKESLIGVMVRVRDPEGEIITEWKSGNPKLGGVDWTGIDRELLREAERASRFSGFPRRD